MRLTMMLLTVACFCAGANSVAQNVSFSGKNVPLEKVFAEVKKQTGLVFIYTESLLDGTKPVTVKAENVKLERFLDMVLEAQGLKYTILNKTVLLSRRDGEKDMGGAFIRGKVLDSIGRPLAGATVALKDKIFGVTDAEGLFSVNVSEGDVLTVTFVGYQPRKIVVINSMFSATNNLIITLMPSVTELSDVEVTVNTGYQNIPKERATGSFVQLGNEMINRNPSSNVLDRILNITSGLRFEPSIGGDPIGNETNLTIRGVSTINANRKPLIVIDGFPYEEYNTNITSPLNNNPLNNINPNDIESITILRDAAAASIWGTRSGNGVIVITTKRGNFNQKPKIQFNSNLMFVKKTNLKYISIISSRDMIEFEKGIFATGLYNDHDDLYPLFSYFPSLPTSIETLLLQRSGKITQAQLDSKLEELSNYDVRDDIEKYFLQNELNQQYNLNISGGSEKSSYFTSIGYDQNRAGTKGNSTKRLTFRFDNTFKPVKQVEFNSYINFTNTQIKTNGFNYQSLLANGTSTASPYAQLADKNGLPLHVPTIFTTRTPYLDTLTIPGIFDWHYRPLDEQALNNNSSNFFSTRIGGNLRIKITSCLSLDFKGQFEKGIEQIRSVQDVRSYEMRNRINSFMFYNANGEPQYPFPVGGALISTSINKKAWNYRNQLNLAKNWADHQVNGILGLEFSESKRDQNREAKYGYDGDKLTSRSDIDYSKPYVTRPFSASVYIPNYNDVRGFTTRSTSYFTNFSYAYLNRYTLTASGRVDASNFFGSKSNDRWIPLFSTGTSWDISRELFYQVGWLPYLRFRATYGYNGNMNNKATALPTAAYDNTGVIYGLHSEPTLRLITAPNPGLRWEKVKMFNIGIDLALKNNRLSGSMEYYTKKGENLIGEILTESSTGVSTYTGNYANMSGKGIDISLNSLNVDKQFKWATTLLLSYNTEKVTHYNINDNNKNNHRYYLSPSAVVIGKPLAKIYAYRSATLDPQNGDPRGYLAGNITGFLAASTQSKPEDLIYFGSSTPQIFGSLINTFTYKMVSLSCNITYKFDYYFRRPSIDYNMLYNFWGAHGDYGRRWKNPGDEAFTNVPSLPKTPNGLRDLFYTFSDALVEKGDHIRLQDVRLNVDLTNMLFKSKIIEIIQLYLYVNNPGIIWRANNENIDPDFFARSVVPTPRSMAVGCTISL